MGKVTSKKKTTKKKTVAKKTAAKKTAAKKTTAKKTKSPAKAKSGAKKKPALKDLILKKFDSWKPESLFKPVSDADSAAYTAPPFFSDRDEKEIRSLLAKKFDVADLKAAAEKAAAEKAAAEKAAAEKAAAEKAAAEKAAAEKAAAEKAAAEKAAAEKAAAEKAAAEKAAAEKAAAEKAAAEKAAAEKAAAEKAAAEKAAAEKAAAEKAAAEKAAAEKAAAEKAAAEKAAAEKAAAEKAAAEKVAAEKAAAEKAAAEKAEKEKAAVRPAPVTKPKKEESEPVMDKTMKLSIAAFAIVMLIIIGFSASNRNNYYLEASEDGVEVWRGEFAPLGEALYVSLPGVPAPETIKACYTRAEINPLAFGYFINQADMLLAKKPMPDFSAVRGQIEEAIMFANSQEDRDLVNAKRRQVNLMDILCKADIEAAKGTMAGFAAAVGFLKQTSAMRLDKAQADLVSRKTYIVEDLMKSAEAAEKAAAEEAAAKAAAAEKPAEEKPAEEKPAEKETAPEAEAKKAE